MNTLRGHEVIDLIVRLGNVIKFLDCLPDDQRPKEFWQSIVDLEMMRNRLMDAAVSDVAVEQRTTS